MIKMTTGRGNAKRVIDISIMETILECYRKNDTIIFKLEMGANLYGGTKCYTEENYVICGNCMLSYYNNISTISGQGCSDEYEKTREEMEKFIKSTIISVLSKEEFVSNDHLCPTDDDGMWWNNHRAVANINEVLINNGKEEKVILKRLTK